MAAPASKLSPYRAPGVVASDVPAGVVVVSAKDLARDELWAIEVHPLTGRPAWKVALQRAAPMALVGAVCAPFSLRMLQNALLQSVVWFVASFVRVAGPPRRVVVNRQRVLVSGALRLPLEHVATVLSKGSAWFDGEVIARSEEGKEWLVLNGLDPAQAEPVARLLESAIAEIERSAP